MTNRTNGNGNGNNGTGTQSFQPLLDAHEYLDELFRLHQKAVLQRDFTLARERLREFRSELLGHMRAEEYVLLPIYERAGAVPGGPVHAFTGEHQRMLEFLKRFDEALAGLESSAVDPDKAMLVLLDEQTRFKLLCERHLQREESILYPTLDRVTSDEERAELLEECFVRVPKRRF